MATLGVKTSLFCFRLTMFSFPPSVLAADDAFAGARVPQRELHLRVGLQAPLSLYALGSLHPCLPDPWVSDCPFPCHLFPSGIQPCILLTVTSDLPSGQDNDINLMKACWNELFALGLAQCSSIMNVGTILSAIINHLQTSLQEGGRAQPLFACTAERLTRHPRE